MAKNENSDLSILEIELLKTLSFMEPMSLDLILLDLDKTFSESNPQLSYDDLNQALNRLVGIKKIKVLNSQGSNLWIRNFPKRTLLQRVKLKLGF